MDSDESRPGSSASNSSSSSNSNGASPASFRKSRSKTRSKSPASRSSSLSSRSDSAPKSPINGLSHSPSPNGDNKSLKSISSDKENNRSRSVSRDSIQSMSSEGSTVRHDSTINQNRPVSRNQSISPVRKNNTKSSPRNSSVSSVSEEENFKSAYVSDAEAESEKDEEEEDEEENKIVEAVTNSDENHAPEAMNMSHEDLSDVSDVDSVPSETGNDNEKEEDEDGEEEEDDENENENEIKENVNDESEKSTITDLRQKLDERKNQLKALEDKNNVEDEEEQETTRELKTSNRSPTPPSESVNNILEKKNDEDALDFEAEEGECNENVPEDKSETKENEEKKDSEGEVEDGEELEEGEVSDEDEKRPEETEPKPVCRFYTRGQCTWGMSCRFLHPGVTDKGNYTMFDMIRPVPVPHSGPYGPPGYHDFRNDRPPLHHVPPSHHHAFAMPSHARPPIIEPAVESAWERGLRTAKEMMRKANKRKEQDMDFEDKKMNLSASQDELEKDNYYIRDRASPEVTASPQYPAVKAAHFDGGYSPPPKYPPARNVPAFDEDSFGRSARYRELPPHRMPQYEDEIMGGKRRPRPAREVIVQRAEPVGRGDEWNDPWMRSKSPGRDKRSRRDRRSYSSNSSYSSSSSSHSGSSSNTSRSPTPNTRRRRFNSSQSGHKSPITRRHIKRSPTPKRRHSPIRRSPPIARKRNISPPPVEKRTARVSPPLKRKRPSPSAVSRKPAPGVIDKTGRKKRRSSSSGSGSSDSSGSDSGSSYSSSSSSSSRTGRPAVKPPVRPREKVVPERKIVKKEMSKKRSPLIPENKTSNIATSNSTVSTSSSSNSKKTTRREELLKQLRAVEDAIARKRSKLN